ncbi:conserved hypothetical protein [Arthrobacter sp. 9AX]|uniref:FliH/SctL family protein n=1 Tax=Arthrobacter sp. 9AX TaxID=2653131 RepID=UPI0012F1991F|nr:hypothetical protein [Arthrobacter sp. 9AX]VXB80942.1 conserved hypothetical protein [Arthrobacter sp. 9AX]
MSTEAPPITVVFPRLEPRGVSEAQERGYVQGHAAGYAAGLRAAAAEQATQAERHQAEHNAALDSAHEATEHAVALLGAAAAAFQQRFALLLQDAEAVLAASALELAEAVLAYELHDGDRTARAALQRALSPSGSGAADAGEGSLQGTAPGHAERSRGGTPEVSAVRMHPDDVAVLQRAVLPAGVHLVPDPSLARGDAMAQYPSGWLDARLGTALARARAVLLGPEHAPEHTALPGRPGAQP